MLRQIDYTKIQSLFEKVKFFSIEIDSFGKLELEEFLIQKNRKLELSSAFLDLLSQWTGGRWGDEKAKTLKSDIDLFLVVYVKIRLSNTLEKDRTINGVQVTVETSPLIKRFPELKNQLEFLAFSYMVFKIRGFWESILKDFDPQNWDQIYLFADLLPLTNVQFIEVFDWLSKIIEKNPEDVFLDEVLKKVIVWGDFANYSAPDIELLFPMIFRNKSLVKILPTFICLLEKKQKRGIEHYLNLVESEESGFFWYEKMFAIGNILPDYPDRRELFFNQITSLRNSGKLSDKEFILLCGSFGFTDSRVTGYIDQLMSSGFKNGDIYIGVGYFLSKHNSKLNAEWFHSTLKSFLIFNDPRIEYTQSRLFIHLINENADSAYEVVNYVVKNGGSVKKLEKGLLQLVRLNSSVFQRNFLTWLNSDDIHFHKEIFVLSAGKLPNSIFEIPKECFEGMTDLDLAFMASKTVGFVYAKDPLQKLLLSIIKAVDIGSQKLSNFLGHLLKSYLIYNYRSTLKIIRTDINSGNLYPFAKELFVDAVTVFQRYFDGLDSIAPMKEIKPASNVMKWVQFYRQRSFTEGSKKIERNGIFNLSKKVYLNSHKWAIKRPNELVHDVRPLGNIRVETEYPSGENLNPVYQESIRVQMKILKRHEINLG
ncbi:hypothetical protein D0X99_20065 [Algoriphagus lacus]|uniref:Uncharacterized protein n=1 Tax=Algoriphagus lacus TaxID=2056311 RepID=A0A418PLD7_9BACT|nr:hypothetical protein [Algoriphagus lacus]RIW11974.1 hypothetical protein D0X99_20065 [Algoriphagus lacus]